MELVDTNKRWEDRARLEQQEYFETFVDYGWEGYKSYEFILLKKKIGYTLYGPPKEVPGIDDVRIDDTNIGYSKKEMETITKIALLIKKYSQHCVPGYDALLSLIFVSLNDSGNVISAPVFRVPCVRLEDKQEKIVVFIDSECKVYKNWDDYLRNNRLPACDYCYPVEGMYKCSLYLEVCLGFGKTPASKTSRKVLQAFDWFFTAISVCGLVILGLASLAVPVVAPLVLAGAVGSVASSLYGAGRAIADLVDMKTHDQSLLDSEAWACYLSIAGAAIGAACASAVAVQAVAQIAKCGEIISKTGKQVITALNISSHAVQGAKTVNDVVMLASKENNSRETKENDRETKENDRETKENDRETKENDRETKENDRETKENDRETKENDRETKENDSREIRSLTPLETFQISSYILFFSHSLVRRNTVDVLVRERPAALAEYKSRQRCARLKKIYERELRRQLDSSSYEVITNLNDVLNSVKSITYIETLDDFLACLENIKRDLHGRNNLSLVYKLTEMTSKSLEIKEPEIKNYIQEYPDIVVIRSERIANEQRGAVMPIAEKIAAQLQMNRNAHIGEISRFVYSFAKSVAIEWECKYKANLPNDDKPLFDQVSGNGIYNTERFGRRIKIFIAIILENWNSSRKQLDFLKEAYKDWVSPKDSTFTMS